MVWTCIEKRRRIRREESDGHGGAGEKKERKIKAGCLYNISNDLSERELSGEDAQGRTKWRRLIRGKMRKKKNVVLYTLKLILRASKGNINFYFRLRSACPFRSIGRREASICHGHWRSGGLHASWHLYLLILTGLNYWTPFHAHYIIFSSQWPLHIICDTYHLTCFDAEWMHLVQEQILIEDQIRKIVQHILQERFDTSGW